MKLMGLIIFLNRFLPYVMPCWVLFLFLGLPAHAQDKPATESIAQWASATNSRQLPTEKLYLHLDRPDYSMGDTLWFKAYNFEGTYLTGSQTSGIYYVELANDSNRVVKRMKLPLKYGLGWGNIALDEKEVPEGNYTLRAYTNWMLNLGEEAVFTKSIVVSPVTEQGWLVNSDAELVTKAGKDSVRVALRFSGLDKRPIGLRDLEIRVMDGKKTLYKDNVRTGADGRLDVNFVLPGKSRASDIGILAGDLDRRGATSTMDLNGRKIAVPLSLNRPENTDLQFMPEGGHLVAGIRSKVGFKAIGEDGKSVAVTGKVVDSKYGEVAAFSSLHKGMGSFELAPQAGERYTAQVTLPDGTKRDYPLPEAKTTGTTLGITDLPESGSLRVVLSATPGREKGLYLIGRARGVVCYAKAIDLSGGTETVPISKSIFPSGIVRFSLLDGDYLPLNERIVYVDHRDNLDINITAEKDIYNPRDSIALQIRVRDAEGKPVQGSFSLSVTDDGQVKPDSTGNGNIATYLLLSSDLKGHIEDPDRYTREGAEEILDNLMLTQGWTSHEWKDILHPKDPLYAAEPEFTIRGRATSTFGGIPNTKVNLFSQKPLLVRDTVTDQKGRFSFTDLPLSDSASYKVQAFNRNGKSFIVDVEVEEWEPPVFTSLPQKKLPWYLDTDTALLRNIKGAVAQKKEESRIRGEGILLEEAVVTGKKAVPGSHNLNGPGGADLVLDVKDMLKEGKTTLWQLLFTRIKGIIAGGYSFPPYWEQKFGLLLQGQLVKISIDGIDLDRIYEYYQPINSAAAEGEGMQERYLFMKSNLENFTAEDILGIEIMYNMRYNMRYNQSFLSLNEQTFKLRGRGPYTGVGGASGIDYAYLEITTRNGQGPFINKTRGVYWHRPLPFSFPRQFYRPRYAVKENDPLPDRRSTLHWEPHVVTDADGKAIVSFYAADKPSTYTVMVEGSDMDGKIGNQMKQGLIKVVPTKPNQAKVK